jgi:hypothetical protein
MSNAGTRRALERQSAPVIDGKTVHDLITEAVGVKLREPQTPEEHADTKRYYEYVGSVLPISDEDAQRIMNGSPAVPIKGLLNE